MDLLFKHVAIQNFRSIRVFEKNFSERTLLYGGCNQGKTTLLDAICLCLGRNEWTGQDDIFDFHFHKSLVKDAPQERFYSIFVTLSNFPTDIPEDYPKWFGQGRGKAFWWNESSQTLHKERQDPSDRLACQVCYYGYKDKREGKASHKRFLTKEPFKIEGYQEQEHLEESFFDELGLVYFPLVCLEWSKDFLVARDLVRERAGKWMSEQKKNLASVSDSVTGAQKFMEKARSVGDFNALPESERKGLVEELSAHMDRFKEAIALVNQAAEQPEEEIYEELMQALPLMRYNRKIDDQFLERINNPNLEDILEFLVTKSREKGASRAFEPLVKIVLERKKQGKRCIILFDELEHFIPNALLKNFPEHLLELSRQAFFISHEVAMLEKFHPSDVFELENNEGAVSLEPADFSTFPDRKAFCKQTPV